MRATFCFERCGGQVCQIPGIITATVTTNHRYPHHPDSPFYWKKLLSISAQMDTSKNSSSLIYRGGGLTPKKSPIIESVQKRRRDIENSERAAYWAIFNTSMALLLYYDLFYIQHLQSISLFLAYLECIFCLIFTASAFYDFVIHFWPHTVMKPIVVNPLERRLLGIREDEFGFKVEESKPVKLEPIYDNLPPFEIHPSFEEVDEKLPPLQTSLQNMSLNNSNLNNNSTLNNSTMSTSPRNRTLESHHTSFANSFTGSPPTWSSQHSSSFRGLER